MILTCPACGTQYVVKDGAIPPQGRQVRCASCRHSWHQDPEPVDTEAEQALQGEQPEHVEEAEQPPQPQPPDEPDQPEQTEQAAEDFDTPPGYAPIDPVAPPADALVEPELPAPPPDEPLEEVGRYDQDADSSQAAEIEDEFSPFAARGEEHAERRRSPLLTALAALLLIAAVAAAFWFLAPPEWKERLGIAAAGETPLKLMMTHSDRQQLASGNELLAVSGRVINPTDEQQRVPPITAELRSASGQLVYSWTIPPPARTLPPGASATFNSAEVNVPAGGDELTVTLGPPRA